MRDLRALTASTFPFLALLYAIMFCAFGTESPFFPSFLASRTLSASQIGSALAAGMIVRLAAGPLLGLVADRFGARMVLAVASLFAGTVELLYLTTDRFVLLLLVSMAHAAVLAPLNPLADAVALAASARERVYPYGWVRGVGSASFVVGTLASGLVVERFGINSIILMSAVLFLVEILPIPRLLAVQRFGREGTKGELGRLLASAPFRDMLVVAGLIIGSHAASDAFAVIHWRTAGLHPVMISLLWSESVVSEIVVFVGLGPVLLHRLGPSRCAAIAGIAGIVRWSVLASTTAIPALASVQLLHGFTFSLMHLACMGIIAARVPEKLSGTAQTLYGALCLGIASAVLTWVSGELYGRMGADIFWLMAFLCLAALPLTPRLRLRGPLPGNVAATP